MRVRILTIKHAPSPLYVLEPYKKKPTKKKKQNVHIPPLRQHNHRLLHARNTKSCRLRVFFLIFFSSFFKDVSLTSKNRPEKEELLIKRDPHANRQEEEEEKNSHVMQTHQQSSASGIKVKKLCSPKDFCSFLQFYGPFFILNLFIQFSGFLKNKK